MAKTGSGPGSVVRGRVTLGKWPPLCCPGFPAGAGVVTAFTPQVSEGAVS